MGICLIVKSGGGVDTSTANATASTIVSGYTCYVNDALVTGSMPKQSLTKTLSAGGSQTIAAGYYTENESKISVSTLASLTGGTDIAASQVLNTYTYWTSGAKGTGTMTNRGTKTWTIGVNGSQTIESGWHSGSGTVKQSSTVATNSTKITMTPTTSNQTLCNASTYYSQERWCAGASTLAAGNIKKDVSIFGVTGSYYETKRYIIQNGQNTGLCTLTANGKWFTYYPTGVSGTTVSYNGGTWLLYEQNVWTWGGEDSGDSTDVSYYYTISGAKNIVSISWTWSSKTSQSATFGFQIGADVWTWIYDGWNRTHTWGTATLYMTYSIGNHAYAYYWLYNSAYTSMSPSSNKYAWSVPSFSSLLCSTYKNGLSSTTSDVMIISFGVSGAFSLSNGKGYGHTTWVKNLWFDTTKTMTK